jgi:hypothetical protein
MSTSCSDDDATSRRSIWRAQDAFADDLAMSSAPSVIA